MDNVEFFQTEIKRLIKIKGLKLKEFLAMVGEQPFIWQSWDRNHILPDAETLYKMSQILEVSMEYFFRDERVNVIPPSAENVLKKIIELPPDDIKALDNLSINQLKAMAKLAKSFQEEM